MVSYVGLQATAARLIKAYGVAATLQKKGAAADYDPISGTADAANPAPFDAYVVRNAGSGASYETRDATGTLTATETCDVLMSVQGTELALGDMVLMDGLQWRVYAFTRLAPGATVLCYEAGLARI